MVLTFESVDEILKFEIQMKATEQNFPVLLFTMLYKVTLTIQYNTIQYNTILYIHISMTFLLQEDIYLAKLKLLIQ